MSIKIHILGVAGSGMKGLVSLLVDKGYQVTGSDQSCHECFFIVEGYKVPIIHDVEALSVHGPDAIIYSSAIPKTHPVIQWAITHRCFVYHRAQYLALLMGDCYKMAISGCHGKTSTTALMAQLLMSSGQSIGTYVGGDWCPKSSVQNEIQDYFVFEADESDGSLLRFFSDLLIVLNIDQDHVAYYKDQDQVHAMYARAIKQSKRVVFCCDDGHAFSFDDHVTTVGFKDAHWIISELTYTQEMTSWCLVFQDYVFPVSVKGVHTKGIVMNISAVCVALQDLDIKISMPMTLPHIGRRQHILYQDDDHVVVSDYAHHPKEILEMIRWARLNYPAMPCRVCIEPHRYSRLSHFYDDYVTVLNQCDEVFLMPVYAAGETNQSLPCLKAVLDVNASYVNPMSLDWIQSVMEDRGVLLCLGAGNIHDHFTKALQVDAYVS